MPTNEISQRPAQAFVALALGLALATGTASAQPGESGDDGPYTIRSVDFQIQGRTRDFILMSIIDPYQNVVGSVFPDRAGLEAFVADKSRQLMSQRVLAAVTPSYEMTETENGHDVALSFATTDSWNIVGLPYAKYDSNEGLLLSLRGRDYNFLGSAEPLQLNLNYQKSPGGIESFGLQLDFVAPFRALGAVWGLGFVEDGQVWTDGTTSSITAGSLSYNVPGLGFPASVTVAQSYLYEASAPSPDPDSWYLGESAAATATIPITGSLGHWSGADLGPVNYIPSLEIDYSWKPGTTLRYYGDGTAPSAFDTTAAQALQNSPVYYGRGGFLVTFSNGLAVGRIDWAGNMREGLHLSVTSREAYNAQWNDLIGDIIVEAEIFEQWDGAVGVGARLYGIGRLSGNFPGDGVNADYLTMLGQYTRGIIDRRISAVQVLVLNGNLGVKLFDFPTHALIKTRALDFELQAQPFLDLVLARPDNQAAFSGDWFWSSGGLELLFYPQALRSFTVRTSAGWDLRNVVATRSLTAKTPDGFSPYEIYLGLSLLF
jgi:hypothetical protein